MGRRQSTKYLTFRGIMFVLLFAVAVPVTLVTSAGIVAIILGRETVALVTGILVTSLAAAVFSGVFVILMLLRRGIRLAREQETFLSNVTHELRTPLSAIRLYAETLRMGRISDRHKTKQCLDTILSEAVRLEQLIERVLQWRRIAEGKKIYRPVPALIREPVYDALESFKALAGKAEVLLDVDVEKARTMVNIDRTAVADVVFNLLSNSFKYTGDIKEISVRAHDVDGGVTVAVQDNGVGIPEEQLTRIFERFFRVDRRSENTTSGTGLGLAIVKHVMDFHGGHVRVESTTGEGSVFRLFFPKVAGGVGGTEQTGGGGNE